MSSYRDKVMIKVIFSFVFLVSVNSVFAQSNRIVNGKDVKLSSFPWSVTLQIFENDKPMGHFCGGAIISKRYILTAAHCVVLPSKYRVEVHGGGSGKLSDVKKLGKIKKIFAHPKYQDEDPDGKVHFKNDIALIYLGQDIRFNKAVKPIKLIKFRDNLKDLLRGRLGIAGWGLTDPPDFYGKLFSIPYRLERVAEQLQYSSRILSLPLHDSPFWKSKKMRDRFMPIDPHPELGDYARKSFASGGFILTHGYKGASACFGDSGSVLFKRVYDSKYKYKALGLTSFGAARPFCKTGVFYTNIQNYLGWIYSIHEKIKRQRL